jgi:hypothetical protein
MGLQALSQRRDIRGALRLAQRLQSGGRRPRPEVFDSPFVGPPAVDLLTLGSATFALVAARNGFTVTGAALAAAPMLAFALALALRVRIKLLLPFTTHSAKWLCWACILLGIPLMYAGGKGNSGGPGSAGLLLFGFAFFYAAGVALAEERVHSRHEFVERDERPVLYWVSVVGLLTIAVAMAVLATLPRE